MARYDRDMKQKLAIVALLSSPSIRTAAATAGISVETMHRWLRDPAFKQQYAEAKRELVEQATALMRNALGQAVIVITDIMNDVKAPTSCRLMAASKLIDLGLKAIELEDIEGRIDALEQLIKPG